MKSKMPAYILRSILKLILGNFIILASIFLLFKAADNLLHFYEPYILKWLYFLGTFIGFYFAGRLTKNENISVVLGLFISLVFYKYQTSFFYFSFMCVVVFFGILGILLNRKIKPFAKWVSSVAGISVFLYFLFSHPLIIKNDGYYLNPDGTLHNVTEVWNFSSKVPKKVNDDLYVNLEGNGMRLQSFEGKTIYLTFWATWCKPCLAEKPLLDSLKNDFKDDARVVFVDISLDENNSTWEKYLNKMKPKGIQLISEDISKTRRGFNIYSLPKHAIVNKKGDFKRHVMIPYAKKYLENDSLLNKWIHEK